MLCRLVRYPTFCPLRVVLVLVPVLVLGALCVACGSVQTTVPGGSSDSVRLLLPIYHLEQILPGKLFGMGEGYTALGA